MVIELNEKQVTDLTVLINCELRCHRDKVVGYEYGESLNGVFKQLTGEDHEDRHWWHDEEGMEA